jgi:glycosyltransferase involved in cell wall biosynthesis
MKKSLVSIIVPIYNSENSLSACIESIINQTYDNFELILINDGSTDTSEIICKQYASLDSRIHYINQTNSGASAARNHGIKIANGEWILFIDSDDYISKSYLSDLISLTRSTNVSLIVSSPIRKNSKGIVSSRPLLSNKYYFQEEGIINYINSGYLVYSEPHSKLFNTKIIKENSISFPEGMLIGEDAIFIADFLKYSECLVTTNKQGYYYCDSETSIQRKKYDYRKELLWFSKLKTSYQELAKKYNLNLDSASFWIILSPMMNRYLQAVCSCKDLSLQQMKYELLKLDKSDFKSYGKGRIYGFLGIVSKQLLNFGMISLYIYLSRIKNYNQL